MGHFAELDKNNKVLGVYTACNEDIANHGGEQSEEAANYFASYTPLSENGVKYIQTSYNNNFRKQYAGIGYTYDPINDVFISPKEYESWVLDENFDWKPPTGWPNLNTIYDSKYFILDTVWNEENKNFIIYDAMDNIFPYTGWNLNNENKYQGPVTVTNYPAENPNDTYTSYIDPVDNVEKYRGYKRQYVMYWDVDQNEFKIKGVRGNRLKYNATLNQWESEFDSWTKNTNGIWEPPVEWPSNETYGDGNSYYKISWDESNLRWKGLDNQDNTFYWEASSNSWISYIE